MSKSFWLTTGVARTRTAGWEGCSGVDLVGVDDCRDPGSVDFGVTGKLDDPFGFGVKVVLARYLAARFSRSKSSTVQFRYNWKK